MACTGSSRSLSPEHRRWPVVQPAGNEVTRDADVQDLFASSSQRTGTATRTRHVGHGSSCSTPPRAPRGPRSRLPVLVHTRNRSRAPTTSADNPPNRRARRARSSRRCIHTCTPRNEPRRRRTPVRDAVAPVRDLQRSQRQRVAPAWPDVTEPPRTASRPLLNAHLRLQSRTARYVILATSTRTLDSQAARLPPVAP